MTIWIIGVLFTMGATMKDWGKKNKWYIEVAMALTICCFWPALLGFMLFDKDCQSKSDVCKSVSDKEGK